MNALPLIQGYRPAAPLLWGGAGALSQGAFLGQAARLARILPEAGQVLNLCESRRGFLLGFAAALLRGQTSLLPPNKAAATVAGILARYPGSYVLADAAAEDWPDAAAVPAGLPGEDWNGPVPLIPAELIAALPFTSGSTGEPLPHAKSWGGLVSHIGLLSQRLGFAGAHLVGTVPPQHTYGLETTVLAALAGGAVTHQARPFFPQDVRQALEELPAPRLLITTPVHLQALVQARLPLPPLAGIVSATAPLTVQLAAAAEDALGAPVHEIYGSTESGAAATRRTCETELWLPLPGVVLEERDEGAIAAAPHLPAPVRLADLIETQADGRFRLLGRSGDLIKVAGKRMSLAELNHRLLAIPGVEDGVVFLPDAAPDSAGVLRPAGLVVAPELGEQQILDALRQNVDPAFLPRPLRRVERLPRNEVGKLPRALLLGLLKA
ncbi:MAG TPA: AMP-binding protein [Nevskia sp.]|nr:AMP-binding protein [Nevskia sp.]